MADFVQIDPDTGVWLADVPDHDGGETDEIKSGPVPEGFILPKWTLDGWEEGASAAQQQAVADQRAEQALVMAAREKLATLRQSNKSIAGDLDTLEAIVLAMGKAGHRRARALESAALAVRQAYQAWINNPPTAQQAVSALTTLFTAVGTHEETRRQAEIEYLEDLREIKEAIDTRNPDDPALRKE